MFWVWFQNQVGSSQLYRPHHTQTSLNAGDIAGKINEGSLGEGERSTDCGSTPGGKFCVILPRVRSAAPFLMPPHLYLITFLRPLLAWHPIALIDIYIEILKGHNEYLKEGKDLGVDFGVTS